MRQETRIFDGERLPRRDGCACYGCASMVGSPILPTDGQCAHGDNHSLQSTIRWQSHSPRGDRRMKTNLFRASAMLVIGLLMGGMPLQAADEIQLTSNYEAAE